MCRPLSLALLLCLTPSLAAQEIPVNAEVRAQAAELGITLPATIPADWQAIPVPTPNPPASGSMAPWPTIDWSVSTPAAQNMDPQLLLQGFQYGINQNSRAIVVIRNGYIVGEWYAQGWDQNTRQTGYSMAKSVTSALVGMAVAQGDIPSIHDSVSNWVTNWQDPEHAPVTVRDLLAMESGLHWDFISDYIIMPSRRNQSAFAISQGMDHTPGTRWVYHNMGVQVLSETLKKATGKQPHRYAIPLGKTIGMWNATWMLDQAGNTLTYQSVIASAREFAKFGYLFLRQGSWDGQQPIPASWIAESTQPSQALNPFYGYLWWLNTGGLEMADVPADAYYAAGLGEKRIYVIPSQDLLVVRLGEGAGNWDDNAFLGPISQSAF